MIENVLRSIGGIAIFGVFSICLFFTFFIGMFLWAVRLKKNYLNSMQALPLDDSRVSNPSEPKTDSHHE